MLSRPSVVSEGLDTHRKALAINLDPRRYGTFAEIGAGQEVVRWFFRVGGAAGTIAKSISAYDMAVSDAIYGHTERYVARKRLQAMLDHEHELNLQRLREARGDTTAFFAFSDTVSARNFKGTNDCHGWIGVKFQAHPRDQDSQIIIHVRMLDTENHLQQEALGIVGVNLLYGAFFMHHDPDRLIESLLHNLTTDRIEIDMIEFSGIEFRHVDNRVMSLKLVQLGLSGAAMFGAHGEVLQPAEVLHRHPVLVERGSFRPVTRVNIDMLNSAHEAFSKSLPESEGEVVQLLEITMRNLMASGEIDYRDFLARADMMAATGKTVLISDYFEYYRLAAYLRRHTSQRIGVTMGAGSLLELFDEKYYAHLDGGILESFGRLFKNDLKIYVYPMLAPNGSELITIDNLNVAPDLLKLFGHLVDRSCIVQLENFDKSLLHIFSRDALKRLKSGDPTWQDMVPPEIADVIRKRGLLGYHPSANERADDSRTANRAN